MFEENKKRGAGASAHPPRARLNGHGFRCLPRATREEARSNMGARSGAKRSQREKTEASEGRNRRPASGRPGRPRGGSPALPAPRAAQGRSPRPFRWTIPASPPLDSPVSFAKSLSEKFLQRLNNAFPLSATPTHPALAGAHTLAVHTLSGAPRAPPPAVARPPARPGWAWPLPDPGPGPLGRSAARRRAHLVGGGAALGRQPAALGQRRGGALMLPVHGPGSRGPRGRAAQSRAERGHGHGGSRG